MREGQTAKGIGYIFLSSSPMADLKFLFAVVHTCILIEAMYFCKCNLEASSDYCERAVGIQGRLEDIQERLDDCRKVCIGGGRLVTLSMGP